MERTCIDTPETEVVLMYPIARILFPALVMIKEWVRSGSSPVEKNKTVPSSHTDWASYCVVCPSSVTL